VPGSRGSTIALVSLSALALLVAGVLIAGPNRTPESAQRPPATRPTVSISPPSPSVPASKRPATLPGSAGRATARTAARDFLADYLRLIRGRESPRTLSAAAPELRRDLRRHPARPTPALQVRPTTIRAIGVSRQGEGSVRAIATVQVPGGPPYPLLLYLERRGARWLVMRIGDA
jgi:hypothetical protein